MGVHERQRRVYEVRILTPTELQLAGPEALLSLTTAALYLQLQDSADSQRCKGVGGVHGARLPSRPN